MKILFVNENYKKTYIKMIDSVLKKTNFRIIFNLLKLSREYSSEYTSPKQINEKASILLYNCLDELLISQTEYVSLQKNGLLAECYGLNYADLNKAGLIELKYTLSNSSSYVNDFETIERSFTPKEVPMSEKMTDIEIRLAFLENKLGIKHDSSNSCIDGNSGQS